MKAKDVLKIVNQEADRSAHIHLVNLKYSTY